MKKNRKSKSNDARPVGRIPMSDLREYEKPDNHKPGKGMAKDKPRLDLIRSKVSSESPKPNADLLESPQADSKALQLQNLTERHKIDQASKVFSKEKASKKKTKFTEIKQKIEDGFYDNPNQLAELAERLIRRFGLE